MANHDDTGQQETLDSSTEGALSGEQAPEQEAGKLTGQGEFEQGIMLAQEAGHDQMSLQEYEVPPDEVDAPPQGDLEPGVPTSEHQGDQIPGSPPEDLSEREVVPVPTARLEGEGAQLPNE